MKKIQLLMLLIFPSCLLFAQNGNIKSFKKISATSGNFSGITTEISDFGRSITNIGDIDNDGYEDLAVGAYENTNQNGIIFILLMNKDKSVKSYTIIGPNKGGLTGIFSFNTSSLGSSLSTLTDLDNDSINELVFSNALGGGNSTGQLYIAFLGNNSLVRSYKIIGSSDVALSNNSLFGSDFSILGDLDKDGIPEIAVGASGDNDGGSGRGAVYILFINKNANVKKIQKISSTQGNFKGILSNGGNFGKSVSCVGDLNNDGFSDLAVAATSSNDDLWILFLDSIGKVKSHQKISQDSGNYTERISYFEGFGARISNLGDLDGDNINDLAISSPADSVNGFNTGRVRILFMNTNGTVKSIKRLDNNAINFNNVTEQGELFGIGMSNGFDFNGDFKKDLIVGSTGRDDGGTDKGAIYLLSLDGAVHPTPPKALWRVNAISGNQNTVFNFTQYSTGFPSAYKWSITPNTFTYQSGTSDTSANPIIKFNQTANYSVQLKVTNPFSSDSLLRSSYINIQTVGINNLTKNSAAFSIFPNPSNGLVQIQSPISIQSILVFDITGKQLLQQEPNTQTDEININNLPQGLYQIHIQTEMGVVVKKLVKE